MIVEFDKKNFAIYAIVGLFISIIIAFILFSILKYSYVNSIEEVLNERSNLAISQMPYSLKNNYLLSSKLEKNLEDTELFLIVNGVPQARYPKKNLSYKYNFDAGLQVIQEKLNQTTFYYNKYFNYNKQKFIFRAINYSHIYNTLLYKVMIYISFIVLFFFTVYLFLLYRLLYHIRINFKTIIKKISTMLKINALVPIEIMENTSETKALSRVFNLLINRHNKIMDNYFNFNAKLSHELNSPLTIVRGEVEVTLIKTRDVGTYKNILLSILEEIDTLQIIIDNMLLLGKLNMQNLKPDMKHVRLDEIIEDAINYNKLQASKRFIKIQTKLLPTVVKANTFLLIQAISNLINNAIKYSKSNSNIVVEILKEDQNIIVNIIDNGIGIDIKYIEKIFDPYTRLQAVHNINGEGLGLTIVKMVLNLHDADIQVKKVTPKGSMFSIIFKVNP